MRLTLALLLLGKAILIALAMQSGAIELGPDEAQYWTWSQALDIGYYSKPPGIAWQIALGTWGLGDNERGVRALSNALAIGQASLVFQLARGAGLSSSGAWWSGLMMAFSPLGLIGSFFAITDVAFLLCWTGACVVVVEALTHRQAPSPLAVGGWVLGGALFKWPIYLFWLFYCGARLFFFPFQQKQHLAWGIALSLLALLPSLWWNGTHDWATFRHVWATLQGGSGAHPAGGNIGAFLAAQGALASPLLAVLFCLACRKGWQQRKHLSPSLLFCFSITLSGLALATILSCVQKIQGNWVVWIYPTAWVIIAWYVVEEQRKALFWVKGALFLSSLVAFLLFLFPHLFPLKHNRGYKQLGLALERLGYDYKRDFLVSDKYQTTSLLSFYASGQRRAYFLNLHGCRKNQFSYWPSLDETENGKSGYFIWVEDIPHLTKQWQQALNDYAETLNHYFEQVEPPLSIPLVYNGTSVQKMAFIFRCHRPFTVPIDPPLY